MTGHLLLRRARFLKSLLRAGFRLDLGEGAFGPVWLVAGAVYS
jgi:hypothetical protein